MAERGYLLLSASASGYGKHPADGIDLIISGFGYRNGLVYWAKDGDGSASATIFASPDPGLGWYPISSIPITGSSSAILSGAYGHIRASVFWTGGTPSAHLFLNWADR